MVSIRPLRSVRYRIAILGGDQTFSSLFEMAVSNGKQAFDEDFRAIPSIAEKTAAENIAV